MNSKENKLSLIAFVLCILIAGAGAFLFFPTAKMSEDTPIVLAPFTSENYNIMHADTLIHLIQKKYGSSAVVTKASNSIKVNITGANEKTRDFFNGNDELLGIKNEGFDITYDKNKKSINATFSNRNGGVVVPNDVLINLAN